MTKRKVYDPRPPEPLRFKTCECGHSWGTHGFRWWLLADGKCVDCMCPRYKEIGQLTTKEQNRFLKGKAI